MKAMEASQGMQEAFDPMAELEKENEDSDEDFMLDGEEEKIQRQIKEMRSHQQKEDWAEKQEQKIIGHGKYQEIVEEEFLPVVTKSQYVVCHFYHKDFERCKIIDFHLKKIAPVHTESRFVNMDAEKCPFFIQKLSIQTLPTIIMFMDGIAVDRIIGFEELGNKDEFPTMALSRLLVNSGVIKAKNKVEAGAMKVSKGGRQKYQGDDSD